jgi:hypothetical protein
MDRNFEQLGGRAGGAAALIALIACTRASYHGRDAHHRHQGPQQREQQRRER